MNSTIVEDEQEKYRAVSRRKWSQWTGKFYIATQWVCMLGRPDDRYGKTMRDQQRQQH